MNISCSMASRLLLLILPLTLLLPPDACSQTVIANFIAPDTVCVGETITLTNTSTGGSTYYWNFCSGNTNNDPSGVNIGNPGSLLSIPTYLTLVKEGNDCFSFVSCQGVGVVRYFHGTSFANNPVSWTNLGTFGLISFNQEGIQVKYDNGQWYGFVCSLNTLIRLDFGTSLWNTPTATNIGPFSALNMPHGLEIIKQGTTWIGFTACSTGNKLVRFNFGTSLTNTPALTDFGNMGVLSTPSALSIIFENSQWYLLVSSGSNNLARFSFGTSLLNTPTAQNLGNPGGFNSTVGLTFLRDCETTTGYFVNYLSSGQLGKLLFPTGVSGTVTGTILGNIGSLNQPHSFSEIFRQNDTLFAYITNRGTGTLTRLSFPPCSNASIPSSTLFNPPSFSYNSPGIYNIRLLVNEGLPNQASICKSIVVSAPPCNLIADFTVPDSICVGATVTVANQTSGGSTYYWNFCSGNTSYDPIGVNIGNPGSLLNIPVYMALAKDGSTCYSFITNQGSTSVIRYNHGTSFSNNPVSSTNLGSFGMLTNGVLGIEVKQESGQWYAFVCNNTNIVRLSFGSSLSNTPTATMLGPYGMLNVAHCIEILNENGIWVGYLTCSTGNKLVRLNFGNSLLNIPVLTDLGAPGSINIPASFKLIQENGNWYGMVANTGNNTYTRLSFGTSLLNNPTGINLGIVCPGINPGGITLIRDCEGTNGFQLNYSTSSSDLIWRLNFPFGITGPVTGTSLGNIGGMSRPAHFSDLFRVGDTLFLYVTNRQNFTLTRLRFLPCTSSTVPSSTLYNPPAYSYTQPGIYNVQLIVNEGQANQASLCKNIVVGPAPVVNLGADRTICPGTTTALNAGLGFSSYLWSTGATTSSIVVGTPGSYWVKVTHFGCEDFDTVIVSQYTVAPLTIGPDAVICDGLTYTFDAGVCTGCSFVWSNLTAGLPNVGTGPTYTTGSAATYMVTRTDADGCIKRDTAILTLSPAPVMTTTPLSQTICSGSSTNISLTANLPGTSFSWSASCAIGNITGFLPGTGNSITQTLTNHLTTSGVVAYVITPLFNTCAGEPVTFNVLVKPAPFVTNYPPGDSICSGDILTVPLQSSITGSTFTWTASGSSGSVTGFSSGTGDTIKQTLFNSAYTNQTVTYFIVATAQECAGPEAEFGALVHPVPDAWFEPAGQSLCNGDTTELLLRGNVSGTLFNWTATGSSGSVSGYGDGSGDVIAQILTNTGFDVETVTYTVTPVAESCLGANTSAQVEVSPVPDVFFNPVTDTVCSGDTIDIFLLSHVTGPMFSWTANSSSPWVSGFTADTGNHIRQELINSGAIPASVTYVVTPSSSGCAGLPDSISVLVKPRPAISFLPASLAICSGSTTAITISSQIPATTYFWSAMGSTPDISGYSGGTGSFIAQTLVNSGFREEQATYIVSPEAEGCFGNDSTYIVTVFPVADVIFTPPGQTLCSGESSSINLGSNITGATFSWTALSSSVNITGYSPGSGSVISQQLFNTGTSMESVIYSIFPEINHCPGTHDVVAVWVSPPPVVTLTLCHDTLTTTNAQPVILRGGVPLQGTFSGNGIINNILFPAIAGEGTHLVTYSYSNAYGCESQASQTLTIVNPTTHLCGDTVIDIRDSQQYPTVNIGTQCWLARNLNYGVRTPSSYLQRDNCIPEKFCLQESAGKCAQYGGLYQWDEMMTYREEEQSQGLCLPGWHIPSQSDWETLFAYFINNAFAAKPLLYSGYSGFNAPLSGTRFINMVWDFEGFATLIWSSTSHGPYKAWAHGLNDYDHGVSYYPSYRLNAFSVRCLKD
ncbi:MAG: hypothetical protein IH596_00800 [Bacteroidales bacterium]|nr:hypothetical protein [Bacteroidales bacterium]